MIHFPIGKYEIDMLKLLHIIIIFMHHFFYAFESQSECNLVFHFTYRWSEQANQSRRWSKAQLLWLDTTTTNSVKIGAY
jgi:hypothetical protein